MELTDQQARVLGLLRRRGLKGATTGEIRARLNIGGVSARISDLRNVHGFDIDDEAVRVEVPTNETGEAYVARYWLEKTLNNRRRLKRLDSAVKVSNKRPLKKAA